MTVGFAVVGSCGAAAFKFVCKVRGAGSTDPKQFFSLLLVWIGDDANIPYSNIQIFQ